MTRATLIAALAAAAICLSSPAQARTHLELGLELSPTMVQDPAFEAFSEDDLRAVSFGFDARVEVASLWRNAKLLPVIGYRVALDEGAPYGVLDTSLTTHDLFAGLRLRGWLKPALGVFLQVTGGACWIRAEGSLTEYLGDGSRTSYDGDDVTWSVGGLAGLEFRLSPAMLERRGVRRFNFGGEIGGGYLRRGEVEIDPSLGGGDENSLPVGQTESWGALNLSGWVFQIGVTLSFF